MQNKSQLKSKLLPLYMHHWHIFLHFAVIFCFYEVMVPCFIRSPYMQLIHYYLIKKQKKKILWRNIVTGCWGEPGIAIRCRMQLCWFVILVWAHEDFILNCRFTVDSQIHFRRLLSKKKSSIFIHLGEKHFFKTLSVRVSNSSAPMKNII